jgi:hemolysin D
VNIFNKTPQRDISGDKIGPFRTLLTKYIRIFRQSWAEKETQALTTSRYTVSEADFLPGSLAVVEQPSPVLPRITVWTLAALFLCAILWSVLSHVDIVVITSGKVLAAGNTKPVQSPETLQVNKVYVKDGDWVQAGQALIEFITPTAKADRERQEQDLERALASSWAFQRLLTGLAAGTAPNLSQPPSINQSSVNSAKLQSLEKYNDYKSRREKFKLELAKKVSEKNVFSVTLNSGQEKYSFFQKLAGDYQKMYAEQAVSEHAWQEKLRQAKNQYAENEQLQAQLQQANVGIDDAKAQLQVLESEFRLNLGEKLREAVREAQTTRTELDKAINKEKNLVLRSPIDGQVQQLAVFGSGAVATAGQALLAVVPKNAPSEIQVQIENRDIGFVNVGQTVQIKFEAFNYTRYGTVTGIITNISSDAIADEKGVLRYVSRIALAQNHINIDGKQITIEPGMSVTAEIKTGTRRVITYFLSPIIKYTNESIRER